jgi:hypothetical protein
MSQGGRDDQAGARRQRGFDVGMTDRWFYAEDGATSGPAPFDDLVSLLSQRTDWKRLFVWRDGFDAWTRADKVPEIVNRMVVPPPPQTTGSSRNQLTVLKRFEGLIDGNASVILGVIIGTALVLTWTMLFSRSPISSGFPPSLSISQKSLK